MSDYRNQKIVIVGAGLSGRSLARYFAAAGAQAILSDQRPAGALPGLEPLEKLGVIFDLGGHSPELFRAADLIAISPGVPLTIPALREAQRAGVPILGEVEIAWRELTAPLIGVTGTNGKSTTTTLLGEIFRRWGKTAFVGGNLGTPLIEAVTAGGWDYLVAELSSFQLEAVERFRPRYALLLNITEDHLDRYPDYASYIAAKTEIFRNQTDADWAVLNAADPKVSSLASHLRARVVWFSSQRLLPEGMSCDGDELVWRWQGEEVRFSTCELLLQGRHNLENVMAALIPPLLEGCPADLAWQAVCGFSGLPHRMQTVRVLRGITWVNDSKGTNVGSVVKSLAGLPSPVTLIAGGKDKGGDYAPLCEAMRGKVTHLLLIGEAAPRLARELADCGAQVHRLTTLAEAVTTGDAVTPPGGTVLLSPACSSFDMYNNYEERGRNFAELVAALPEQREEGA